MKNILCAFLILICCEAQGQQIIYDKDCSYLQQFEGEWKFQSTTEEVKIFLKFQRVQLGDAGGSSVRYVRDYLLGWHEYKKNGLVIESNYNNRFMTVPFEVGNVILDISILLSFNSKENLCFPFSRVLNGRILDLTQCNQSATVDAVVNAAGTTMLWKQQKSDWWGHGNNCNGLTLPMEFTLVKQ